MIALWVAAVVLLLLSALLVMQTRKVRALEADNLDLHEQRSELRETIKSLEDLNESYQRALNTRRGAS